MTAGSNMRPSKYYTSKLITRLDHCGRPGMVDITLLMLQTWLLPCLTVDRIMQLMSELDWMMTFSAVVMIADIFSSYSDPIFFVDDFFFMALYSIVLIPRTLCYFGFFTWSSCLHISFCFTWNTVYALL
jgi:hypothetical protein